VLLGIVVVGLLVYWRREHKREVAKMKASLARLELDFGDGV